MSEILLTSSVLILAILILRRAFRDQIPRRAQYALWALVLARLLVPVSLPGADFSVLSAAEPVGAAVTERLEQREIYLLPQETLPYSAVPEDVTPATSYQPEGGWPAADPGAGAIVPDAGGETATRYAWAPTAAELLTYVWISGIAAMAVWFLVTNLRFWRKLRRARTPYAVEDCRYPVYLVEEGLPSPCLFGLFRPAIYLTPAAVASPERLRHVLAHEAAHARHGDPLWSLLRCVCLAVYWFDPLVWAAAAVSKTDGELACDEAAICTLGEAERIPYGRTLLSLIPVRRGPGAPLLSATTMAAGKRQLKDRVTRIAKGGQTRAAALFLALALAAGVCAVTFTGAKAAENRPLTGDELAYFNEQFFNAGEFNIHNQFLTSLYEQPEDIDLLGLFYCGTGLPGGMSDEELRQVGAFDETGEEICPTDKLPVADMNQVLLENTGLTLEETGQTGLESLQYLPEYDAYYHSHGDTNYRGNVTFTAGEREGDTIRLYYEDFTFGGYGTKCVTLDAQADGSYWFVSHTFSEKPATATVYPGWDPALTVQLTDLAPYAPVLSARQAGSVPGEVCASWNVYSITCSICRFADGSLHAVLDYAPPSGSTGGIWDAFTFPADVSEDQIILSEACGLLGYDCVVVSYRGYVDFPDTRLNDWINDYYSFDGDGNPILLARVYGDAVQIDLDGDGVDELCASSANTAQLFFQRDGQIYEVDIDENLERVWPEAEYLHYSRWDVNYRRLFLTASVPIPDSPQGGTADRWVYFDGESLLVYRDGRTTADHVMEGAEAPEDVMEVLRDYVLEQYTDDHEGLLFVEGGDFIPAPLEYDDWRIESIEGPSYVSVGGLDFAIWNMNYELHTTTPESVTLAGGRYMTEDCWVSPGYPGCDYFYFQLDGDGNRTYLYHRMENDCVPGTELFFSDMAYQLREMGLL